MATILMLTAFAVFVTYIFGLVYAVVGRVNRKNLLKSIGWTGFCILGFIGVPFHELMHLITALLFNHDVTDFALYRPIGGRRDGQLGYVYHTYNPHSLYQKIGNFFIGIAPMLGGASLLTILLNFAVPEANGVYLTLPDKILTTLQLFINSIRDCNIYAILMLFVAMVICPHISMSAADVLNSMQGLIFVLIGSLIVPYFINYYLEIEYNTMIAFSFDILIRYIYVLFVGLIVSIVILFINKILSIII